MMATPRMKRSCYERLGIEARLKLVEKLWNGITMDSAAVPLTQAQRNELDRRIAEHEANTDDVVHWEKVKSALTKRLKK